MRQVIHPTDIPAALRRKYDQQFVASLDRLRPREPPTEADPRGTESVPGARQSMPKERPPVRSPCDSLGCIVGHLGQVVLGVVVLLLGIALIFTLWLMPVGLPLALFGAALMGAGAEL